MFNIHISPIQDQFLVLIRGITPKIYVSELCPLSYNCTLSEWASILSLVLIPFILFEKWATLKVFAQRRRRQQQQQSSNHNISTFSSKQNKLKIIPNINEPSRKKTCILCQNIWQRLNCNGKLKKKTAALNCHEKQITRAEKVNTLSYQGKYLIKRH